MTEGSFVTSAAATAVALALVLALAWGSLWLLRRVQRPARGDPGLRFVRALPVGSRERVVVLHYEGEEWVLGVTAGSISLLARKPLPCARGTAGADPS